MTTIVGICGSLRSGSFNPALPRDEMRKRLERFLAGFAGFVRAGPAT
jgi:hypothetical protein